MSSNSVCSRICFSMHLLSQLKISYHVHFCCNHLNKRATLTFLAIYKQDAMFRKLVLGFCYDLFGYKFYARIRGLYVSYVPQPRSPPNADEWFRREFRRIA